MTYDAQKARQQATFADQAEYQTTTLERIMMYDFDQIAIMHDYIDERFQQGSLNNEMMKKFLECKSRTEQVIKQSNILLDGGVEIGLTEENEKIEEELKDLLDLSQFQAYIQKAYLMWFATLEPVGIIVHWIDGQIDLRILTADKYLIVQDENNPKKIKALYYEISTDENINNQIQMNTYIKWTNENQKIVEIDRHKFDGNEENEKVIEENPNPLGMIPVAWFQGDINDSFYYRKGHPLIEANKRLNIEDTIMKNGQLMYAWAKFQIKNGNKSTEGGLDSSMFAVYNFPYDPVSGQSPEASYVSPTNSIIDPQTNIDKWIDDLYASFSINPAVIRGNSTATSGYQLKLEKNSVLERAVKQRSFFSRSIKELVSIIALMHDANGGKILLSKVLSDIKNITTNFKEYQTEASRDETARADAQELANGTTSIPRILMRNDPDLSLENAIEKAKTISEENKALTPLAGLEIPTDDEN